MKHVEVKLFRRQTASIQNSDLGGGGGGGGQNLKNANNISVQLCAQSRNENCAKQVVVICKM